MATGSLGRPTDGIPRETAGFPGTGASRRASQASPPAVRRTAYGPPVNSAVGDEVVRGAVRDAHGHHVARSGTGEPSGDGEVHQPVVPSPARQARGGTVLAPLAGGHEHLDLAALHGPVLGPGHPLLEGDEPVEALLDNGLGNLVRHRRGGRAGPHRVLEGEGAREARGLDDPERLGEVVLGLTGEPDDDVGRDGGIRDRGADRVENAEEPAHCGRSAASPSGPGQSRTAGACEGSA